MLDDRRLDGKVAVITGAAGQIGAATVRLMAARGARIVAVDYNARALEQLSADLSPGPGYLPVVADVTDERAVAAYVEQVRRVMGRIDIFFNNAGVEGPVRPIAAYPLPISSVSWRST